VRKAFCAVVTKSGNLKFLEPSGPLQACNGTALPVPINKYLPTQSYRAEVKFIVTYLFFKS